MVRIRGCGRKRIQLHDRLAMFGVDMMAGLLFLLYKPLRMYCGHAPIQEQMEGPKGAMAAQEEKRMVAFLVLVSAMFRMETSLPKPHMALEISVPTWASEISQI